MRIPTKFLLSPIFNSTFPTGNKKGQRIPTLTFLLRAENETRTRDPNLGKVMLYQLSYFRNYSFRW